MSLPVITTPAAPNSLWTEDEIAIVKALYGTMRVSDVAEHLPGRSRRAINRMGRQVGATRKNRRNQAQQWLTPERLERLRDISAACEGVKRRIAAELSISRAALYNWEQEHPEIKEAIESGKSPKIPPIPQWGAVTARKLQPRKPHKCDRCVWARPVVASGSKVMCLWPTCVKEEGEH